MRVTSLLHRLLGVPGLWVTGVGFQDGTLLVSIRRRFRLLTCPHCQTRVQGRVDQKTRRWRHRSLGGVDVVLVGTIRRLRCPRCVTVVTEAVPWARHGSRFTRPFEDMVAYLAQKLDRTAVAELTGVAWETVGSIAQRLVRELLDPERFEGLRRIGVDEISYRRHHRYLTVVIDHDRGRVIWAAEGKSSETLLAFFRALTPEQLAGIELVSLDMSAAYIKALREALPHAKIAFDKFHLVQLAQKALDQVRRELLHTLPDDQRHPLRNLHWALRKNPDNLLPDQEECLADLQSLNRGLYRGHLLKEAFLYALAAPTPALARRELQAWLAWASRSRLRPFVRLGRTVRRHFDGILTAVTSGLTNARLEGMNNKIRLLSHRAYGFHSADPLIATIYLCCSKIPLMKPHLL